QDSDFFFVKKQQNNKRCSLIYQRHKQDFVLLSITKTLENVFLLHTKSSKILCELLPHFFMFYGFILLLHLT
ncbi:MAG: hypothetical protein RR413_07865, partial [Christensenellaceae bacterium]